MDTKAFNEKNFGKSRTVCEGIEREDGGERVVLTDREREILDMWPRYEDGEPVMPYDRVQLEDGDVEVLYQVHVGWGGYSLYTETCDEEHPHRHRLRRHAPKVLAADGMEICKGEILRGIGRSQHLFEVLDPHHVDPELGSKFSVRCRDLDEGGEECHCIPRMLTHTRPDSWERLEEDASKEPCFYFGFEDKLCDDGAGCPANKLGNCSKLKASDIIRRAKALAGVEE